MKNRIYNIAGSPKSEARSSKHEAGTGHRSLVIGQVSLATFYLLLTKVSWKQPARMNRSDGEVGRAKHEDGSWMLEDRSWKLEVGRAKHEDGSWKLEDRSWKLEDGRQKSEVGSWKLVDCSSQLTAHSLLAACSLKREEGSSKKEVGSRKLVTSNQLNVAKSRECNDSGQPATSNQQPVERSKIPRVQRFGTTSNNKPEAQSSRLEARSPKLSKYHQCNALYLPLKFKVCKKTFEGLSLLPRGSAGFGAIPGAAAITTIISFFNSSPRDVSENAATRRLARFLPVINQSTLHQGSFVPLKRGTRFALANQGVKETIPNNWIEGTKPERRYVTN